MTLSYFALAGAALHWLVVLVVYHRRLRAAEVVVVTNAPRAFGTLFITIDMTRRLYRGKRIVFVSLIEKQGHNELLGMAFPDIEIVQPQRWIWAWSFVGRSIKLPPTEWHDPMAYAFTSWWLRRFGRDGVKCLCPFDIWHEAPLPDSVRKIFPIVDAAPVARPGPFKAYSSDLTAVRKGEPHVGNELHLYGSWNTLRAAISAPAMRLPANRVAIIKSKLSAAAGGNTGLCGLHTRYGGTTDKIFRDGSPLEFYIPAIRRLVSRGYQVLIQGDRSLHPRFRDSFEGMVVDADSLQLDDDEFRLFCGTETDIFIGDWPVAPQLANVNDIPTLVVNAWPVGWGINDSWVYYRGINDKNDNPWHWKRVLRDGPLLNCNSVIHNYPELYGYKDALAAEMGTVCQRYMDDDEILDAVECFLNDVNDGSTDDPYSNIAALLPIWTPFAMATNCRLSPAWVRHQVRESTAVA
jgi:hypothetical protein